MAGDTSFFRSGSGQGLSELVMEFPGILIRDRKGTPKNFCDKDFAELSGELSGANCLKTPFFHWVARSISSDNSLVLFVRFFWLWCSFGG